MQYCHFRLTAFVAKSMHEARFGEWEQDLFIPLEMINKMVTYLCSQQNKSTGAWDPDPAHTVYDRKMVRLTLACWDVRE